MELSVSTNILFERTNGEFISQKEAIEICAESGYKVIDFCFHDLITYDSPFKGKNWKEYFIEMRDFGDKLGVRFEQGHAIVYDFCREDIDHKMYEEWFYQSIVGAEILGVKWLVVHPSTVRDSVLTRRASFLKNVEFFKKWVTIANNHNVGLAVENMWDLHIQPIRQYCVAVEELVELVDAVPGLGVCWDCEHAEIMKISQQESLSVLGNRLKVLHISDFTNTTDIHLLPYLGITNWDGIYEALATISYDGLFNFEIHKYLLAMPRPMIPDAVRFSYKIGQYMIQQIELRKGEIGVGRGTTN